MSRTLGSKNKKTSPTLSQETTLNTEVTMNNINENIDSPTKENTFYIPRNYARSNVQPLWAQTPSNSGSRKYTSEQIGKLLINPYNTFKELQGVSNYLLYSSAIYNNFLDYLSNILTFDYVLYATEADKVSKATIQNRIISAAKTVSKINVKTVFPTLLRRVLSNGECYFYNSSDKSNTIIVEIDSKVCQLAMIDDSDIWRYYVNLNLIDPLKVYELPEEIQNEYNLWVEGGRKKAKKKIQGFEIPEYMYLVSNKGFAMFSHMRKTQHDYPYLTPMFEDLSDLESDKDYMNEYIKQNNIKLIHMQIPTDKDSGVPLMPEGVIRTYHESAKEHLPSNIAPLTNPFITESITLDSSQSTAINLVDHSTKVVTTDSGISDTIFNASTTNGLMYSTLADASKIYPFLFYFENFVNLQIEQFKCTVKFLKINQYNQEDWHKTYGTDLLNGGSRMLFVASSGIELYDFLNMAETESILDMDNLLRPKINASQMSGNDRVSDPNNKGGTPTKNPGEAADSTNKVNGYK